jgi:hypothetical protein
MVQWFILNSSAMMKLLLMKDYTQAYCVHFTKFLRTTPPPPPHPNRHPPAIWMHGIWTIMTTEFPNRHPQDNRERPKVFAFPNGTQFFYWGTSYVNLHIPYSKKGTATSRSNWEELCEISGSHSGDDKVSGLLKYVAVSIGKNLLTFRSCYLRNVSENISQWRSC